MNNILIFFQQGITAVEYALLLALVGVGIAGAYTLNLGEQLSTNRKMDRSSNTLSERFIEKVDTNENGRMDEDEKHRALRQMGYKGEIVKEVPISLFGFGDGKEIILTYTGKVSIPKKTLEKYLNKHQTD